MGASLPDFRVSSWCPYHMRVAGQARGRIGGLTRAAVAAMLVSGALSAVVATGNQLPTASAQPPTDSQGYLDSPTRCAQGQSAVLIGRTALSLVAICADGRGGYQYHGSRLSDRAVLVLPAKAMSDGCFGAHANTVDFTVSAQKLLLTSGVRVLRDEPMIDVKDYRTPSATPAIQQAAVRQSR